MRRIFENIRERAIIPPESGRDIVVVLHGLGMFKEYMAPATRALEQAGFDTLPVSYASHGRAAPGVDAIAADIHAMLADANIWNRKGKVHFLTHSMGGVIADTLLMTKRHELPAEKIGRVVMLAPPNRGSEIADFLKDFGPYRWLFGQAGQDLTTAARARQFDPPYYDLGVIAGTAGHLYFIANLILPGGGAAHDGRVSVASTEIEGMKAHFRLSVGHTAMAWNRDALKQAVTFLKTGDFNWDARPKIPMPPVPERAAP